MLDADYRAVFADFMAEFLPPGASCGHDVLYDWHRRLDFAPDEATVAACIEAFARNLLSLPLDDLGVPLSDAIMDASQLALAHVGYAYDIGIAMPRGGARVDALVQNIEQRLAKIEAINPSMARFDSCKRLRGIIDNLESGR